MITNNEFMSQLLAANTAARIALPEANDPRVLEAACSLAQDNIARPVLIMNKKVETFTKEVQQKTKEILFREVRLVKTGGTLSAPTPARLALKPVNSAAVFDESNQVQIDVFNNQIKENQQILGELLLNIKRYKGLKSKQINEAVADPLTTAALLTRVGLIDAAVAGATVPSADVIRAGIQIIGTMPGIKTVSSCFLMLTKLGIMTFADCAIVPEPNAEQLADIAIASAKTHQQLTTDEPRIALLSFSTKGSAAHKRADKVINALQIIKNSNPQLCCDGELQVDAAIIPEIAATKAPQSEIDGRANVLIFPDLDSGNIGYKLTQRLGEAIALGPLVQGLKSPFMDVSRGCSAKDIVLVAAIAGIMAAPKQV